MSNAGREITALMRAKGVIPADAPEPPEDSPDRPWFVSLLQGVAGWLAGILLLCFFWLVFKPESSPVIFGRSASSRFTTSAGTCPSMT